MAKVKRKIEEVLGLTQDRRERSTVYHDLSLADKAPDPFLRALQEADEVVIAPPEAEAGPAPPEPTLPPETPPEVGAEELMRPPEPEPTGDVEEEKKRALFNTLTELIDLGRIERNEADIRKYAGDHEDELGELAESLDSVLEMLIMDAKILRTPQTFDVEASPSDAEKKQAKPGVGPAVQVSGPEGILQAADQSKGKGKPVMDAVDRILAGEDVSEVLKEEVRTATISNGRGGTEVSVSVRGPARRRGQHFDPAGEAEKVLRGALGETANVKRATATSLTVTFGGAGNKERVVGAVQKALEGARYSVTDKTTKPGRLARAGRAIKRGLARVTPGVLVAQAQESVTEQMDIARVGVAVEIRFSDKKEAQATKGALLQYKGIDSVEETTDNTLVAFTTDEDVEEARNRVTTILQNARIPIESVQIEHFEPLVEARVSYGGDPVVTVHVTPSSKEEGSRVIKALRAEGHWAEWIDEAIAVRVETESRLQARTEVIEVLRDSNVQVEPEEGTKDVRREKTESIQATMWTAYNGPDVMPTPVPVAHGMSGADEQANEGKYLYTLITPEGAEVVIGAFETDEEAEEFMKSKYPEDWYGLTSGALRQRPIKPGEEVKFGAKWLGEQADEAERVEKLEPDGTGAGRRRGWVMGGVSKDEMVNVIQRAEKARIGTAAGEDYELDDVMAPTWGPRAEWEMREEGPFSGDSGEQETWETEREFLMTQPSVVDLKRSYEAAKKLLGQTEQAEEPELDTGEAPGDEEQYLRPYFEPDGEEMPPEEEVEGTLWRMDVPEDPSEFDSLAEVLNRAKDAGLIASWVRVSPGEEEMPPEEPEGEVLDMRPEAAVGIDYGSGLASVGEAREELPPVADLEPDDTPVDELPPEEVPPEEEPEKEYIAVEFAPEVDQEEMEGFPEWVAAETEDPETGEGVVTVLGWEPAGEEPEAELPSDEELPPEDDEFLMPDEEPELNEQGAEYQQYLQTQKELRHAVKHAAKGEPKTRVTPRMWRAAGKKPAGPELPPDVQMLVKDYKAAMSAGDEEMARRIRGELEFELQTLGIDPKAVLGG